MPTPLDFATHLAQEAGELLLGYFQLEGMHADLKSDRTVVTEADLTADRYITEAIRAAFPHDQILSEEGQTTIEDPGKPTWVVDPLDGTVNFSLGLPIWGVSIARTAGGHPETAALAFPALGEVYGAQRGEGACLNQIPIRAKPLDPGQPSAVFACCSRTQRGYELSIRYKARILGSAAYDFCSVARGAAAIGFQSMPKIWDVAAGWLLLQEAGGVVEVHHGEEPFPLSDRVDYQSDYFPTLMAGDAGLMGEARQGIRQKPRK